MHVIDVIKERIHAYHAHNFNDICFVLLQYFNGPQIIY